MPLTRTRCTMRSASCSVFVSANCTTVTLSLAPPYSAAGSDSTVTPVGSRERCVGGGGGAAVGAWRTALAVAVGGGGWSRVCSQLWGRRSTSGACLKLGRSADGSNGAPLSGSKPCAIGRARPCCRRMKL
ncbi:hypothetical protein D3C87_1687420 [compost metagenome]